MSNNPDDIFTMSSIINSLDDDDLKYIFKLNFYKLKVGLNDLFKKIQKSL